jgi:transposase
MNLHLAEVSTQVAAGAHGIVVCDGAGWHQQGDRLRVPANLTLLSLPPYAPELNPVENIWQYLRGNRLSITVRDSYEQIVDACCLAWNWLIHQPGRIASIASRAWAQVRL